MNHKTDLKYAGLPERVCRECGAPYPAHTDFFKRQHGYWYGICRTCDNIRHARYLKERPDQQEKKRLREQRYRERNRERVREIQLRCYHKLKLSKPRRKTTRFKWEQVRDILKANPALISLTSNELRAHLPEPIRDASHTTICKARNYVLRGGHQNVG